MPAFRKRSADRPKRRTPACRHEEHKGKTTVGESPQPVVLQAITCRPDGGFVSFFIFLGTFRPCRDFVNSRSVVALRRSEIFLALMHRSINSSVRSGIPIQRRSISSPSASPSRARTSPASGIALSHRNDKPPAAQSASRVPLGKGDKCFSRVGDRNRRRCVPGSL